MINRIKQKRNINIIIINVKLNYFFTILYTSIIFISVNLKNVIIYIYFSLI